MGEVDVEHFTLNQIIKVKRLIKLRVEIMLDLIMSFLGLFISFYLLYFITEYYFIPTLDKIANRLKMSSDIAGSTLMAAGSSAPELAVVLFAIFRSGHHEAIGIGTIVGSSLFNLFFIVGSVMLIKQSRVIWQPLLRDLIFYGISTFLLFYFFSNGFLTVGEAAILVGFYGVYVLTMFLWKKLFPYIDNEKTFKQHNKKSNVNISFKIDEFIHYIIPRNNNLFIAFIVSVLFICLISWVLVYSAINISQALNIPELFIGLSVVAIGTSMPDLLSSVITARKGRPGMAINNAIGSNIFDILIGIGLPFLILSMYLRTNIIVNSDDLIASFTLLIGSVIILITAFILTKWRTTKYIGFVLVTLYILYLVVELGVLLVKNSM